MTHRDRKNLVTGDEGIVVPGVPGMPCCASRSGPLTAGLRFWAGLQSQERKGLAKARSGWSRERGQSIPRDSKPLQGGAYATVYTGIHK